MDVAIPIVFPDYRITVDIKPQKVDLLPGSTWDDFWTPAYKDRWEGLGHAGIFFINGETGVTKYYEYGRYDPQGLGWVKNRPIPNAIVRNGKLDRRSLVKPLHKIAVAAGGGGRIQAVCIHVEAGYDKMLKYAQLRESQNNNPGRKPYALLTHSCVHFTIDTCRAAGIDTPWSLDPRPNAYIGEFRDEFPDLDYYPRTRELKLELEDEAA